MLDADVKISKITELRRVDPDQNTYSEIRVDFRVGAHGPFTERFVKDTYTADARDQKLNAFARDVRTTP